TKAGTSSIAPSQSNFLPVSSPVLCGNNSKPVAVTTPPIGTVTQKIQRQPSVLSSTPPIGGPADSPIACAAANQPSARARPLGPTAAVMIAMELAASIAPPTPCSSRAPTSQSRPGLSPHNAEAIVN